jgi:hypothetical protein
LAAEAEYTPLTQAVRVALVLVVEATAVLVEREQQIKEAMVLTAQYQAPSAEAAVERALQRLIKMVLVD